LYGFKLQHHPVKDSVIEMGGYAVEATNREICNQHTAWTTEHRTGADKATYTTVTVHYFENRIWMLKSTVLDFKIIEGLTMGKRIYDDVVVVL
jgi:hypothetical protein